MNDLTLNETLALLGLRAVRSPGTSGTLGRKDILSVSTIQTEGEQLGVLFSGRAGEVWAWLRDEGRLS